MYTALIINAMVSHAMTMMTALVDAVDTLCLSSSKDAYHSLKMNSAQDFLSLLIDHLFLQSCSIANRTVGTGRARNSPDLLRRD